MARKGKGGNKDNVLAIKDYQANVPADMKKEISAAGSFFGWFGQAFRGYVPPPYNPDSLVAKKGIRIYRQMAQDEQIKAALLAKQFAVLSTGYEIQVPDIEAEDESEQAPEEKAPEVEQDPLAEDEEIQRFRRKYAPQMQKPQVAPQQKPADDVPELQDDSEEHTRFIEFVFEEMTGSFSSKLLGIMDALTFGFSCSEKVFAKIDYGPFEGKWGLKDVKTRPPEDIDFQLDAYGNITDDGVMQFSVNMPREKFVIFSYRGLYGNPYGDSDLRAAYRCYSDDTEILAESGWKSISSVTREERVATLNPETGCLEYQYPSEIFSYQYSGKMFHQGGRFVDFLVTPNHNMWAGSANDRKFRFVEAQDLPRVVRYKRDAKWVGEERSSFTIPPYEKFYVGHGGSQRRYYAGGRAIQMDAWLRFFGIWLAEGYTWQRKNGNRQRVVGICQNKGPKLEQIKEWVTACGFHFYEHADDKRVVLEITNAQLFEYLKQFGGSHDKFIPQEFKQLCPRQLRILFDAMMLGDGTHVQGPGSGHYATVSKRLADDVAEIVFKMGRAATVFRDNGGRFGDGVWIVSSNTRNIDATICNEHKDSREWVDYDGMVYCLTVPNHLLYVRRKGKAAWSGNSWWTKDNLLKMMAIALERYAEPVAVATFTGVLDDEQRDDITAFLKNLQSRSGIVLPETVALDFKTPPPRTSEAFIPAINLLDQQLRIAVLMPGLMGLSGEQQRGSYARSMTEFDVFLWIINQLRRDIETVVNEQIIKPLLDYNYEIEHGRYPKFKFKAVTDEARQKSYELFLMGLGAGALTKGPEDENKLRELIDFEPLPEDFAPPDPLAGLFPGPGGANTGGNPFGGPGKPGGNGGNSFAPDDSDGNGDGQLDEEEDEAYYEKRLAWMSDAEIRKYASGLKPKAKKNDRRTH